MKYILLLTCFILSKIIVGQISSGIITVVYINTRSPNQKYANYKSTSSDTTIAIVNGEPEIRIINNENRMEPYEIVRDTVDYLFTNEIVISIGKRDNLYRLYDLKNHRSMNIINKDGEYKKFTTYKLYDDYWYQTYATDPQKINSNNCIFSTTNMSCKCKSYDNKSTKTNQTLSHVELCLTADIQIPIKLFINYSKDILACPVYSSKRDKLTFNEMRLINVEKMDKDAVLEKMDKNVLKFLTEK